MTRIHAVAAECDPCALRLFEQREVIKQAILKLAAKARANGFTERAETYEVAATICDLVKEYKL